MPLCYKIRHILLKMRQYFTTKCDSFNTKCDDFITEFYSYYKMRCLLQNSSEHFSCLNPVVISCLFLSTSFSVFFSTLFFCYLPHFLCFTMFSLCFSFRQSISKISSHHNHLCHTLDNLSRNICATLKSG